MTTQYIQLFPYTGQYPAPGSLLYTTPILVDSDTGDITGVGSITVEGLTISQNLSGGQVLLEIENTSNTANSSATLNLIVGGASAGDGYIFFGITGGGSRYLGYDTSTGDMAISATAIGTSNLFTLSSTGALTLAGGLLFSTAGSRVTYKSGANAATGTATLVAGTVTVNTTAITANSTIKLTRASVGATGAAATGNLVVGTRTPGASFVINAVQAADATALQASDVSTVTWEISELV